MNPVFSGLAGLGLVAAVGAAAVALTGGDAGLSSERVGQSGVYRVSAIGEAASCSLTKGRPLSPSLNELDAEPACEEVLAGMGDARFWGEDEDGLVVISSNGIDPIATFSVGDGFAYESVSPREPYLTLAIAE